MRKRPETPTSLPESTRFQQVGRYKQVLIDSLRSWSLISATPRMRGLRIGLAGIFFACSMIALTAADLWNESAADFFRSMPFYLLVLAGISFFYAIGLLLMGFMRGLIAPTFASLTAYSLYTVIRLQSTLSGRPLILRLSLILLAGVLYGLILYFFISGFRKRHDLFNWIYRRERQIVGVDIALKDLLPIEGYAILIKAVFQIEPVTDEERLQNRVIRLTEWVHHRLAARQMLPCGFVYDTASCELTLFAYSSAVFAKEHEEYCQRILSRRHFDATVSRQQDKGWDVYLEALYPKPAILHDILNEQQLQMLEDEGLDLQDQHLIRLEIGFADNEKREQARERLEANGYPVVADSMLDARERDEICEHDEWCFLLIDLTTRLGLERLNTITRSIVCLIEPLGGDLFGWEPIGQEEAADGFNEPDQDAECTPGSEPPGKKNRNQTRNR